MGREGKERKGDILSEAPDPRKMAGRPVDWMLDIMAEGGVVPVVVSMDAGIEKEVDWMPVCKRRRLNSQVIYFSVSRGLSS